MAKMYVFKVPDIKRVRKYETKSIENGTLITKTKTEPLRELDKAIYTSLFELASSTKKTIAEALLCEDCIDQIKNLSDSDTILKFTESDIEFLNEGFELTNGVDDYGRPRRPRAWLAERRELFEQINKPVSEGEWEKENSKKSKTLK